MINRVYKAYNLSGIRLGSIKLDEGLPEYIELRVYWRHMVSKASGQTGFIRLKLSRALLAQLPKPCWLA